ncbi:CBS domain-containing protein [bacterium]|jgi:putative hemolysin|nr:CBS domain-containing protein [bacterium]
MGTDGIILTLIVISSVMTCFLSRYGLSTGLFLATDPLRYITVSLWSDLSLVAFLGLGGLSIANSAIPGLPGPWGTHLLIIAVIGLIILGLRLITFAQTPHLGIQAQDAEVPLNKLREGVLEFAEGTVRDEQVPINDVFKVSEDDTLEQILDNDDYKPYSRIPVYRGLKDNIVGIIFAKELLQAFQAKVRGEVQTTPIKPHIRDAFFVPEVMEQTVLLQEFQKRKMQMAIVVDEYGVISGIVTLEDLIETIVGEVQDLRNDDDNFVHSAGTREWILDAMIELDDFSELVGKPIESDTVETLGGFVFQEVGFLPSVGDALIVRDLEFTVQEMDGYRIRKIGIREIDG